MCCHSRPDICNIFHSFFCLSLPHPCSWNKDFCGYKSTSSMSKHVILLTTRSKVSLHVNWVWWYIQTSFGWKRGTETDLITVVALSLVVFYRPTPMKTCSFCIFLMMEDTLSYKLDFWAFLCVNSCESRPDRKMQLGNCISILMYPLEDD